MQKIYALYSMRIGAKHQPLGSNPTATGKTSKIFYQTPNFVKNS
jgi:hypothetical protein